MTGRTCLTPFALLTPFLLILAAPAPGAAAPPPDAKAAGGALQTQDTNVAGILADFVECRSREGVLSVKIRLRNTGADKAQVRLIQSRDFEKFYVTAGSKKYFVLRDNEKVPLAPAADATGGLVVTLPKGGAWTWWAKYPSPPASETKITYVWPVGAPFEDVPISR
jgi:hypothetical protein